MPASLLPRLFVSLILCTAAVAIQGQEVRFTATNVVRDIPFRSPNNLIVLQASLNGASAGWFIFDTGAESTVIDTKYAASAGLRTSGKTVGNGAAGSATAGVIKGVTLRLGTIEASVLTVYALPLRSLALTFGLPISGIIGNDVITQTVAEVNSTDQRLTLYEPGAFHARGTEQVVPLTIEENLPFTRATVLIGGHTLDSKMEIDTGSTGAMLLNSPFVRKYGLIAAIDKSIVTRTGGLGGTGSSRAGRVKALKIGDSFVAEPLAVLYTGTKGDNASSDYDGLIGGAILRRFNVTIDLAGRRLLLEPTARLSEPFETDMSGLELLADGDDLSRILIDDVKPGSAAAKGGIRGGDYVRSVDGRPAGEVGIQELRRILRTPGPVDLELTRGRRVFSVHLALRRVI